MSCLASWQSRLILLTPILKGRWRKSKSGRGEACALTNRFGLSILSVQLQPCFAGNPELRWFPEWESNSKLLIPHD